MENSNVICIDSARSLQQLQAAPGGNYRLTADIDLQGASWQPMDFWGTLDGGGRTVSNFRITQATAAGHQGFFGCLEENAQVFGLTLTNLTVVADPNATAVGAVAGVNRGKIENCTVGADAPYVPTPRGNRNALTGVCDDSCLCAGSSRGKVGAFVGVNEGTITGAVSYAQLLCPGQGLYGENTGIAQGLCRDVSRRTRLLPPQAQAMRKDIVAHMQAQGDFRWIPGKAMGFTSAYTGSFKIYEKDAVHYGLPYTQKYGSLERAQYCLGADDYVAPWLAAFSDAAPESKGSTQMPWDVYLGNDCSGAVYWAWQRCCPSVEFGYTGDMVPTEENQRLYGVLPVGGYQTQTLLTKAVIEANTPAVIARSYALLRMGDAIVMRDPGYGHTRLVAGDPMVMRDETGRIDLDASYVPTHEQGVGKGSSGRLSTWQLNARYTFRELLQTEYLPITARELQNGAPPAVTVEGKKITGPFSGTVVSNYRIICTTVCLICEADGKRYESVQFTALDKNRHKATARDDTYSRSTVREAELCCHRETLAALPKGRYTYTVSVLLSTGKTHLVHSGVYEIFEL